MTRPLVVLVDDDPYLRILVARQLPDVDLVETCRVMDAVKLAVNGRIYDMTIEGRTIDAVILDRRLPDGDGVELLAALRASPAFCDLPLILMTASHAETDRAAVLSAGADEYIDKVLGLQTLSTRLEHLLGMTSGDRAARRSRLAGGEEDEIETPPPNSLPEPSLRKRRWWHDYRAD